MIKIEDNKTVIDTINAILNNDGICEIKKEKQGIVVVEIKRTLKTPR